MVAATFSVLNTLGSIIDVLASDSAQDIMNKGKLSYETKGRITKLLTETIVVPTIYISKSLEMDPNIDKIVDLNVNILTAMVSRAFTIMTTLKGISASTAFDVLNQKNVTSGILSDLKYEDNLSMDFVSSKGFTFGKIDKATAGLLNDKKRNAYSDSDSSMPAIYSKDVDLKITIDKTDKSITVPLTIKARVEFVNMKKITDALIDRSYEPTMSERFSDAMAGVITWKNFFVPMDLWKAYKEKLIKDTDGYLEMAEKKDNANLSKLATSGMLGLTAYLGSLIISADELEDLENSKLLRGKVSNPAKKDLLLSSARASLLNVVDPAYGKLRILTMDNDGDTVMDIKSLKKKSDGNDITEIFKLLMNSRTF